MLDAGEPIKRPPEQKTFSRDLIAGKAVEQEVLKMIREKYPCATIIEGKHKDYDIWIPELHQSVEVKSDQMSQHTGNIVLEIEMFDKPSALLATNATWWVIYTGKKFIWITPDTLKSMIILEELRWQEFTGKGDTHPKKAYLVSQEIVELWAERVVPKIGSGNS